MKESWRWGAQMSFWDPYHMLQTCFVFVHTYLEGQLDLVWKCFKGHSPLFSVSFVLFSKIQTTNCKTVSSLQDKADRHTPQHYNSKCIMLVKLTDFKQVKISAPATMEGWASLINKSTKFFFFYCLYNPGWVLVCSMILFHSCLSLTFTLQPIIFILFRSSST